LHQAARGSCSQILLRGPDRHAGDGAIKGWFAAISLSRGLRPPKKERNSER
jgi:hypothetical protein